MKVLIGTPVYDEQVLVPYHLSVLMLLDHFRARRPEARFLHSLTSSPTISHARNAMATTVLKDDSFTHLLFIDADMGFSPSLIDKMVTFDRPLTACIYPRRTQDYGRLAEAARRIEDPVEARLAAQPYVGAGDDLFRDERGALQVEGDFLRVRRAGTAVMLIRRDVLEALSSAYPELWAEDLRGAYRPMGLEGRVFQPFETMQAASGIFMAEDYAFCERWTAGCGGEVWACFNETIRHVGRERFVGNYAARMRFEEGA
jgi:hypothetical protein